MPVGLLQLDHLLKDLVGIECLQALRQLRDDVGCLAVVGAGLNLYELVLQGTGLGVGLRDALLQLCVLFFDQTTRFI